MSQPRKLGVCTWTFGNRSLAEIAGRLVALNYGDVGLIGDLTADTA